MFVWNDFKDKYLKSLDKMKKCITDIKEQYTTKEDKIKYKILEYDLHLLQKYENYMNDIDLRLKDKKQQIVKLSERKENKDKISKEY